MTSRASNGWTRTDYRYYEMWRKTPSERRQLRNSMATKLLTTGNRGSSEINDAKSIIEAIDQVEAVLEIRSKQRRHTEYYKKREDLLIKLRAAYTNEGQIVAAILEDESSLTKLDLKNWCDSLQNMTDSAFDTLLLDLQQDGVIGCDEDEYELIRPCLRDLSFGNDGFHLFKKWAGKKMASYHQDKDVDKLLRGFDPELEVIFRVTQCGRKVFYPESLLEKIDEYNLIHNEQRGSRKLEDSSMINELQYFVGVGVLLSNEDWYWIPRLGE